VANQTTSNLTSAIGTRYTTRYQQAAALVRLYDQLATPVGASQFDLETRRGMGTTYTFQFLSDMQPGSTAISETTDITPQILVDATSTITPTSRGEAMKWSQLLDLEVFTDYVASRMEVLGKNMMETVDIQARNAALQGNLVSRPAARASLDAGTTTHNWTEGEIWKAMSMAESLKCPSFVDFRNRSMYMAIAHSDAYYDLFHQGNVISAAIYGGLPGALLFNGELGEIANCKLIISPFAKVFGAAGADNASAMNSGSGYALSSSAAALALTIPVTTGTNDEKGRFLTIGTEETAGTHYDMNERVKYVSGTTTVTIVGQGANGGLRFAHTTADTVYNNDSVYPVAYGSPSSLVKVYANEVGEFGEVVGPLKDGLAEQWTSIAWKWFGGYGRMAENYIVRGEYSSSLDNV
jgi:N4-gp56 family major capsid protein